MKAPDRWIMFCAMALAIVAITTDHIRHRPQYDPEALERIHDEEDEAPCSMGMEHDEEEEEEDEEDEDYEYDENEDYAEEDDL